ncbi:MAG: M48 family peptidase [Nodularia sp. (in: Bacteria)]|nr:MAG: M48 family peptidase [Nodularia sp. (in: cyanobacteria)]
MTTITFGDLAFELRHSPHRRTVGITVERDGKLILTSPPAVSIETLEKIINQKRYWIYNKLLRKESYSVPEKVKEYVCGEKFYYLGRSYSVKLVDTVKQQPPLRLYQSRFELQRHAQTQGSEYFIHWYKQHLSPILEPKIAALTNKIGATPRSIQVRELGYHWGSCGHQGNLYFHWRVAMLPQHLIEYVVVHEMVHLLEPHHNHDFWDRVEGILPYYQDCKRDLAEQGAKYSL